MVNGNWLRLVRFGFVLSLILATACNFPSPGRVSLTPTEATKQGQGTPLPPIALMGFRVQVPPGTPTQDKIIIRLLDEVTGLALNARQYELKQVSEGLYEINLPLQVNSEIKYRFARLSTTLNEEYTTDNLPVRYRLYHVDGPGTIQDLVSAWSDSNPDLPTGSIAGISTDAASGTPIQGLLVLAGGAQTITATDGTFLIEGLPTGIHNLVVYARDGSYRTFQQGAHVEAGSTTPAQIDMQPTKLTNLTFKLTPTEDTLPGVPIRLAGNLQQLGNTFTDLPGGVSTQALRMPALTAQPDGTYQLDIKLPAGVYIEYKYTLGDGYWNAEHTPEGEFQLRSLVVPDQEAVVEDTVSSWFSGSTAGPILFDLTISESTSSYDYVSIQFNPSTWSEPIPMWALDKSHWVYLLYSPLKLQANMRFRYCRNDLCSFDDNIAPPGDTTAARNLTLSGSYQKVNDQITSGDWSNP